MAEYRHRHSARVETALSLLLAVATAACVTAGGPAWTPRADEAHEVVVENHTWSDVRVYLERDQVRFPIGRVGSQDSQRFDLDPFIGASTVYRLVADPLGSGDPIPSDPVLADTSGLVHWTVEARGRASTLTVRSR